MRGCKLPEAPSSLLSYENYIMLIVCEAAKKTTDVASRGYFVTKEATFALEPKEKRNLKEGVVNSG